MAHSPQLAIVPGSFDPLTNGHIDLVERSLALFDRVLVAVLVNETKVPMFTAKERVAIVREVFAGQPRVEVETFDGLLVAFARRRKASAIVKGLRSGTDFDYEMQMALMNRHLEPGIETVFLMPSERFSYISSRLVKEVAALGGSIDDFVPPGVATRLARRRLPKRTQRA